MTDWKLYLVVLFGAICFISGAIMEHKAYQHEIKLTKQYYRDYCDIRIDNAITTCKREQMNKKIKGEVR